MKIIYIAGVLCAALFVSCGGQSSSSEEAEGHEHEEAEHAAANHNTNEISFNQTKQQAVGLQVTKIEPGSFTEVIRTSGKIMPAQGEESVVVATVAGTVRLGRTAFIDGTAVSRGQSLLSISSSNLAEGDVAAKARNSFMTAKTEYERAQKLVADKIVSQREYEQARLNYEQARVAYNAVGGKSSGSGVSVSAPISGFLKNIQVKEGDYVAVGQPLATVSQNRRLVLRAEVSEKYYPMLSLISSANFKTPYDDDNIYELKNLGGRLLSYGKASDANSSYVPVTFEFDNKGNVIPGSFVDVYLLTRPLEGVISVPVSALIEEQGVYSVYTKFDEDGFLKKEVKLGANNGESVQILSGLKAGDEVVTKAAYQIKLASASNAIPAHSHHH
jgi:RND family efflux transporter MFP subunit